ncbi:hypothetical protein M5D96_012745, partial [Drosophila gunungcola]
MTATKMTAALLYYSSAPWSHYAASSLARPVPNGPVNIDPRLVNTLGKS